MADTLTKANAKMTMNLLAEPHRTKVTERVKAKVGENAEVTHVLGVEPPPSPRMKEDLFLVLRDKISRAAGEALQRIKAALKTGLPAALARGPLQPVHFGFKSMEEMIDWLLRELTRMRTGRKSLAAFTKAEQGWEANFVGRILHERLIKHHPKLQQMYHQAATGFVKLLNEEITEVGSLSMARPDGTRVNVTGQLTNVRLIEDFAIQGPTGAVRDAPDFGFLADVDGMTVFIPIEIKLEGPALRKAAAQVEKLAGRLTKNPTLLAWAFGAAEGAPPETIPTANVLLPTHTGTRLVITDTAEAELDHLVKNFTPDEVARVTSVKRQSVYLPGSNNRSTVFYRIEVLVNRDWLVDIVKLLRNR